MTTIASGKKYARWEILPIVPGRSDGDASRWPTSNYHKLDDTNYLINLGDDWAKDQKIDEISEHLLKPCATLKGRVCSPRGL